MLNYLKEVAYKYYQTFIYFQVLLSFNFWSLKYKFEFHKDEEFVLSKIFSSHDQKGCEGGGWLLQ